MKYYILSAFIIIASAAFCASPLATQTWVRNYVSTNAASAGVTEEWVKDYVARYGGGGGGVNSYSAPTSNTTSGVVSSFRLAGAVSLASCTNPAFASMSQVTNLNSLTLAPLSTVLFTNAVAGIYMTFTGGVYDLHDGAMSYVSSTNLARTIKLKCLTNGVVSVYATKVDDDKIKEAKGEN